VNWSAPGKLFLFGEYAVLRGAPAIVTAVDRRVRVRRVADTGYRLIGGQPDERLPQAVARATGTSYAGLEVDVSTFADGEEKLGLGSSAASVVALTAALLEDEAPDAIWPAAFVAHRTFQDGKGSGGDVAASAFGGTVVVQPETEGPPAVEPLEWPHDLAVYPVWTGASADTRKFIDAVDAAKTKMARLTQLAQAAVTAFRAGDTERLLVIASDYDDAMGRLGALSNIPIRTRAHAKIARAVRDFGATAKPSGAGGGDISLVFARGNIDPQGLAAALPDGTRLLDLEVHQPGVRREG
jgi:phosphomevalonate kinase